MINTLCIIIVRHLISIFQLTVDSLSVGSNAPTEGDGDGLQTLPGALLPRPRPPPPAPTEVPRTGGVLSQDLSRYKYTIWSIVCKASCHPVI